MATPNGRHVQALAGAYALGALELDEWLLVEQHVRRCAACATEVQRARHVAELLPYATEPREPPSHLEARVLARVAADSPGTAAGASGRLPAEPVVRGGRRAARISVARRLLPLAAAALLILGLGGWNVQLQRELGRQQQVAALVAHGETRDLVADSAGASAHGRAYLDAATDQVLVAVSRLPGLSGDREYQLWLVRPDGGRDSGGTFRVDGRGDGLIVARTPAGLSTYAAIGITDEPAGGSPSPTTPRVVGGKL